MKRVECTICNHIYTTKIDFKNHVPLLHLNSVKSSRKLREEK